MTQSEWQTEHARLSAALEQADMEWTGFRARGDWDGARAAQTEFYGLRDALAAHDRRVPAKMENDRDIRDLTQAEWQTESDRISREISDVDTEWKILRDKGQWEIARDAQARYHLLRKQQLAHTRRMPKH